MSEKSIAIIGAGIAGLSAGCYAQMNGYHSEIFEMHTLPGGVCTSWRRGQYLMDGCIKWLVGVNPASSMHAYWEELGALEGRRVVIRDECMRVLSPGGQCLIASSDLDQIEKHLLEISPEDSREIAELAGGARLFARSVTSGGRRSGEPSLGEKAKSLIRMLPLIRLLFKYRRTSVQEFALRFRDPFLREAVRVMVDLPDFPFAALLMMLGFHAAGDAGYPIGGSLEFSRAIERRYLQLGGKVHYARRVAKILVENRKAVGLETADGQQHRADFVISAADGHATIFDMLEGKYLSKQVRSYYERFPVFPPLIQVSLGVARDFAGQPHKVVHMLREPVVIAGESQYQLSVKHYSYDPTLAPPGKSVLVVLIASNYQWWKELGTDHERYEQEKGRVAETVIGELDELYPGLALQVEAVDVATPLTWEKYTGNWQAAFEGWLLTTRTLGMTVRGGMKKTLPGLRNFWMCGQWVVPGGGLPSAAWSARNVIRMICAADEKTFVALKVCEASAAVRV